VPWLRISSASKPLLSCVFMERCLLSMKKLYFYFTILNVQFTYF
jgi:hypothetical protein